MEALTNWKQLEAWIGEEQLPEFMETLTEEQRQQLCGYVQKVIDRETAGMDKLFHAISDTMKYIPNFVILAMTKKYIEPPISSKITANFKKLKALQ